MFANVRSDTRACGQTTEAAELRIPADGIAFPLNLLSVATER
jgi:hypothetical protein